jgi:hypothetical protein
MVREVRVENGQFIIAAAPPVKRSIRSPSRLPTLPKRAERGGVTGVVAPVKRMARRLLHSPPAGGLAPGREPEDGIMADKSKIREHMDVFGSDGQRVGTVDRVENESIKLTKQGSQDGQHHWLPMHCVASVDQAVRLNTTSQDAIREWSHSAPAGGI